MKGFFEIRRESRTVRRFFPISQRTDLGSYQIQTELGRIHGERGILRLECSCRSAPGASSALVVRRLSTGVYTLVREAAAGHLPGCVFENDYDGAHSRLTPSIFRPAEIRQPSEARHDWAATDFDSSSGSAHETFSSYALDLISIAQAAAICTACATAGALRMPSIRQVFAALENAVRGRKFEDGSDGFEAARQTGGMLRIGLAFDFPNTSHPEELPLSVWWWQNGQLRLCLTVAEPAAHWAAQRQTERFGEPQTPPFLIIACQDNHGKLVRIFAQQALIDGKHLLPTESGYERSFAGALLQSGLVFLKPVRLNDWVTPLKTLGIGTQENLTWIYRPDFLALNERGHRLDIIEVRGFRPGQNVEYDQLLQRKHEYFGKIEQCLGWRFYEQAGWKFQPPATPPRPMKWPGVVSARTGNCISCSLP